MFARRCVVAIYYHKVLKHHVDRAVTIASRAECSQDIALGYDQMIVLLMQNTWLNILKWLNSSSSLELRQDVIMYSRTRVQNLCDRNAAKANILRP